jgi:hypothetical protein
LDDGEVGHDDRNEGFAARPFAASDCTFRPGLECTEEKNVLIRWKERMKPVHKRIEQNNELKTGLYLL